MEISYQAPDTLEDAIKQAVRYDTAMFGTNRPYTNKNSQQKHSHYRKTNNNNNDSSSMELDQAETSNRKSYNQNNNQKSFKGKCYNCGKQRHMLRNCKSPKARITNIKDNN